MSNVSDDNKKIAKILLNAFDGNSPLVQQYDDDAKYLHVDIVSVAKTPDRDITSYGTIGLSDFAMPWGDGQFPTRLELCAACLSSFKLFPNIIASAAFNIINSKIVCHPGLVIKDHLKLYEKDTHLPHLYFTSPFFWEDDLKTVQLSNKKVSWLLCFPISDAEYNYLAINGDDAFESLLEEKEADIFDISRKSVL